MDIVIVIIEILVAIVWIQQGVVRYVFWENGRPGGGFVPVIFAVIVLAAALAILIKVVFGKNKKRDVCIPTECIYACCGSCPRWLHAPSGRNRLFGVPFYFNLDAFSQQVFVGEDIDYQCDFHLLHLWNL